MKRGIKLFQSGILAGVASPLNVLKQSTQVWVEGLNVNGLNNAGLTNGDIIDPVYNQGSYGDLNPSDVSLAPTYQTGILNSQPVLGFDGQGDLLPMADADELGYIWGTGVFEIVMVFRVDTVGANTPLLGNTFTSSALGFMLQIHSTRVARFFITTGSATAAIVNTPTTFSPGVWNVLGVRGDGTNVEISRDLTTYTSAARTQTYVSGSAAKAAALFSDGPFAVDSKADGALALAMVRDSELSGEENTLIKTHINDTYGFAL